MAYKFNTKLELDIEGEKVIIDTSNRDILNAIGDMVLCAQKIDYTSEGAEKELFQTAAHMLERVLADSYKKVVEGRTLDVYDVVDLAIYVCNEIATYRATRAQSYAKRFEDMN